MSDWRTNKRTRKVFRAPSGQQSTTPVAPQPLMTASQPIFGNELKTQPAIEVYDPDKEAEVAIEYFEKAIVESPTREELEGWRQDVEQDVRLTHGEKGRLQNMIDDQEALLRLSRSDTIDSQEINVSAMKEKAKEVAAEEDNSIFGTKRTTLS